MKIVGFVKINSYCDFPQCGQSFCFLAFSWICSGIRFCEIIEYEASRSVILENSGSFVSYDDPKVIAILIAMVVGYFSKKIVITILAGLISYWIIIFLL